MNLSMPLKKVMYEVLPAHEKYSKNRIVTKLSVVMECGWGTGQYTQENKDENR